MGEHLPEHGAVLQVVTIFFPNVSEKYIWWVKFQQKLPIGNQQIKEKQKGKMWKFTNPCKLMNYSVSS